MDAGRLLADAGRLLVDAGRLLAVGPQERIIHPACRRKGGPPHYLPESFFFKNRCFSFVFIVFRENQVVRKMTQKRLPKSYVFLDFGTSLG